MTIVLFFAGIAIVVLGVVIDSAPVAIVGGVLILGACLSGMFFGEKVAGELSQGPGPGLGRRRRRRR